MQCRRAERARAGALGSVGERQKKMNRAHLQLEASKPDRKWRRTMSKAHAPGVKDWEIIADNLKKAEWSWDYVSALDLEGRTIWILDAHGYGKRFIVRADEMLTVFVELETAIHEFAVSLIS